MLMSWFLNRFFHLKKFWSLKYDFSASLQSQWNKHKKYLFSSQSIGKEFEKLKQLIMIEEFEIEIYFQLKCVLISLRKMWYGVLLCQRIDTNWYCSIVCLISIDRSSFENRLQSVGEKFDDLYPSCRITVNNLSSRYVRQQ